MNIKSPFSQVKENSLCIYTYSLQCGSRFRLEVNASCRNGIRNIILLFIRMQVNIFLGFIFLDIILYIFFFSAISSKYNYFYTIIKMEKQLVLYQPVHNFKGYQHLSLRLIKDRSTGITNSSKFRRQ